MLDCSDSRKSARNSERQGYDKTGKDTSLSICESGLFNMIKGEEEAVLIGPSFTLISCAWFLTGKGTKKRKSKTEECRLVKSSAES